MYIYLLKTVTDGMDGLETSYQYFLDYDEAKREFEQVMLDNPGFDLLINKTVNTLTIANDFDEAITATLITETPDSLKLKELDVIERANISAALMAPVRELHTEINFLNSKVKIAKRKAEEYAKMSEEAVNELYEKTRTLSELLETVKKIVG